jgi:hypothetical protein
MKKWGHFIFDAAGAQDPGVSNRYQHGSFGVPGMIQLDSHFPDSISFPPVSSHKSSATFSLVQARQILSWTRQFRGCQTLAGTRR